MFYKNLTFRPSSSTIPVNNTFGKGSCDIEDGSCDAVDGSRDALDVSCDVVA